MHNMQNFLYSASKTERILFMIYVGDKGQDTFFCWTGKMIHQIFWGEINWCKLDGSYDGQKSVWDLLWKMNSRCFHLWIVITEQNPT